MARPNRLADLEAEFGESPETLIPKTVNKYASQREAAEKLKVAESTVSNWLRQNGYKRVIQWVKQERESA